MEYEKLKKLIESHRDQMKSQRDRWARFTKMYHADPLLDGERSRVDVQGQEEGDDGLYLQSNYVYSYIDTMVSNTCPTNPQITVYNEDDEYTLTAKSREKFLNYSLHKTLLKKKERLMGIHTGIKGRCFIKTVWDSDRGRPEAVVVPPERVFYDTSSDYEDIAYIIEATPIRESEMARRIKAKIYKVDKDALKNSGEYPQWLLDMESFNKKNQDRTSYSEFKWYTVYEVYDFEASKFYHVCLEHDAPLLEDDLPYPTVRNPYVRMVFNESIADSGGVSDISLIENNLDRLNEFNTLELIHATKSVPVGVFDSSAFQDPEVSKAAILEAANPGDMISVGLQPEKTIREALAWTVPPAFPLQFDKVRETILSDIEFTLGMPAYMRGGMGGSDVATEFALTDTAYRTRNGRRSDAFNDVTIAVADNFMHLWVQAWQETDENGKPLYLENTLRGLDGDESIMTLSLEEIGYVTNEEGAVDPSTREGYHYKTIAYSPSENHKMIQLQKIAQYMPLFQASPAVDQAKLVGKITELLGIGDIMSEGGAPTGLDPSNVPGVNAPSVQVDEDSIEAGGTPGGFDETMTGDARVMADGAAVGG